MPTTICNDISVNDNNYYALNAPYNCGQFVFNVDESSFTEDMKRQLSGIHIKFYNLVDGEYIPILNRSVLYNYNQDTSITIYDIPIDSYIKVVAIIDKEVIKYYNIPECNTFPIKLDFDETDISSSNLEAPIQRIKINGVEMIPNEDKTVDIQINLAKTYRDITVLSSSWVSDNTYSDYPYKSDIFIEGVTEDDYPTVIFSEATVKEGIMAPVCSTLTDTVRIYANEMPNHDILIPAIQTLKLTEPSSQFNVVKINSPLNL